jgi:(p)ppGpp synthase/HD superfamily hydrolase
MPDSIVFEAVAFAARAHRHQLRKDRDTPYVSHVFRVGLVVRHVFGFDEPEMLAAALLHDTIEDTATDCDDVVERFGPVVASWVAALTKDMRLPHEEREAEYVAALAAAPWQVKVCKMADVYDNLNDCNHLPPAGKRRTCGKSRTYLDAVSGGLPEKAQAAFALAEAKLAEVEAGLDACPA